VTNVETEVKMQTLAARIDDLVSPIITVPAKFGVDPLEPTRIDHGQLVGERHPVELDRLDGKPGIEGALAGRETSLVNPG
jgi:hypothetical protein